MAVDPEEAAVVGVEGVAEGPVEDQEEEEAAAAAEAALDPEEEEAVEEVEPCGTDRL